jgi:hypothetical protein
MNSPDAGHHAARVSLANFTDTLLNGSILPIIPQKWLSKNLNITGKTCNNTSQQIKKSAGGPMHNKSRSLFFLTILVILSLFFTACGSKTQSTPQVSSSNNSTEAPTTGTNKSITIVIPEDPPSFNPMVSDTG